MAEGKLAIGFCAPGQVSQRFLDSLLSTLDFDWKHRRLLRGRVISCRSGPTIDRARNLICQGFLEHPDRPDWLLMVDSDMTWDPPAPFELMAEASRDRPVVGGLCYAIDDSGKPYPTIYRFSEEKGAEVINDYPEGLCKVDASGAAFLLIHRSALLELKMRRPGDKSPWFRFSYLKNGQFVSEDWSFSLRCKEAGIPIFVDTRVRVGHEKSVVVGR